MRGPHFVGPVDSNFTALYHVGASYVSLAPTFFKSQGALTPLPLLFPTKPKAGFAGTPYTAASNHRSPFLSCGYFLALEHPAHCRGGLLLGGEVQVRIDVGGGGEGAVAQPDLNLLHGDAAAQQQAGTSVPLRYNNDKRKKPLFSRGLSVCRHLFNSFSKLKYDEKIIK